jgi:hypothetical protein
LTQGLLAFVAMFLATLLGIRDVYAHTYSPPYLWYSSSATFQTYSAPTYRATIQSAAGDYDSTEMTVGHTSTNSGGFGYIQFIEGNYGAAEWTGIAEPYNWYNQPCFQNFALTGNCGTTGNSRAHYAYIRFDMADSIGTGNFSKKLPRHEAGHVFGMAHGGCAEVSVMVTRDCATQYTTLQTHDRTYINNNY